MRKTKQLIEEAIVLAIENMKDDICIDAAPGNEQRNKERAETIKILSEAFQNINRRK